ncbi:MAG: hypothetical protein IPG71_03280 [bacterium]|nr:hypothetical protein [bacterium]
MKQAFEQKEMRRKEMRALSFEEKFAVLKRMLAWRREAMRMTEKKSQ